MRTEGAALSREWERVVDILRLASSTFWHIQSMRSLRLGHQRTGCWPLALSRRGPVELVPRDRGGMYVSVV